LAGIPHFKEVVIMATVCDFCGHKTNEVKSGGGIESRGKKITLNVTESSDLSRDVLKVSRPLQELEGGGGGSHLKS
jgi:zinc finger protein